MCLGLYLDFRRNQGISCVIGGWACAENRSSDCGPTLSLPSFIKPKETHDSKIDVGAINLIYGTS